MDIQALTMALDERVDDLAQQAWEIFSHLAPETQQWSEAQKTTYRDQARSRLMAVMAVTQHGAEVGEAIRRDLQAVGAQSARNGVPLQQLTITLRISRDVLLQAAMRVVEDDAGKWTATLLAFSQQMLPAVDRLTDAITTGYWSDKLAGAQVSLHRLETLVQRIPYGMYEVDIDGLIVFANPALAHLAGRDGEDLRGFPLNGVLKPVSGNVEILFSEPQDDVSQTELVVVGPDGGPLHLDIDMVVRREEGVIVGFAGLARQAGAVGAAAVDLSPLARHIHELHRSVEILRDAGTFVRENSSLMTVDQVTEAGDSISRQAQRLMLVVEELDADRRSIQPTSA